MHPTMKAVVRSLVACAVVAAPLTAHAQQQPQTWQPSQPEPVPYSPYNPQPYPPPSAQAPNGQWVAPLSQTTQPTYVPQSVAMSGPHMITDWDEDEPIPPGYHRKTKTRTGMIVAGAVTFGTLYLMTLFVAAIGSDTATATGSSNQYGALYIPGVGPFLQMTSTSSATGNLTLAIDGTAQVAGLAMLIYGITSPRTVLVRDDLATTIVTPMRVGQDGYGLGVVGRF